MREVAGVLEGGKECSFRVLRQDRASEASSRNSPGDTTGGECDERPVEHGTVWKERPGSALWALLCYRTSGTDPGFLEPSRTYGAKRVGLQH